MTKERGKSWISKWEEGRGEGYDVNREVASKCIVATYGMSIVRGSEDGLRPLSSEYPREKKNEVYGADIVV